MSKQCILLQWTNHEKKNINSVKFVNKQMETQQYSIF